MTMFQLMIRSRPTETMTLRHERLMACLTGLRNEWGIAVGSAAPAVEDPGTLAMQQVNLSKYFRKGMRARVSYQNRKYHEDEGKYDDYFTLEFNPAKFDYGLLVSECFEKLVESFHAYR